MRDDFEYSLRDNEDRTDDILKAMVILDIQERLQSFGEDLEMHQLPNVDDSMRATIERASQRFRNVNELLEIREELQYDYDEMANWIKVAENGTGTDETEKLKQSQRESYNAIVTAVEKRYANATNCFFLNARGGTGKTYVLNTILKKVRSMDRHAIALAVAASGIAATLLQGGRTFHSRLKAPLKTDDCTVFDIKKQSGLLSS